MNIIACLEADLEVTPLGTQSRLTDEVVGVPVLRRTVERLAQSKRLSAIFVVCPKPQHERVESLLEGSGAVVRNHTAGPPPWQKLASAARKWSLDGWRGGVGGATCFDLYSDCRLISGLNKTVGADAVLSVPPGAPLIDPILVDRLIEQREQHRKEARLSFNTGPPGMCGIVLDASLADELAVKEIPLGWVFSYKPDEPAKDLVFQPCCCEVPAELRYVGGRLICDTDRSLRRVEAILREHSDPDCKTIGRWLAGEGARSVSCLPHEVEIELTTDDPYPEALLRPRGDIIPQRGPLNPETVSQIAGELSRLDDSLVVLAGFGDPLRHPAFEDVLAALRPLGGGKSVFGLAVRTAGVDLTERHFELMMLHKVDVLQVTLDAWTPELYKELQAPGSGKDAELAGVLDLLDRLSALHQEHQSPVPILLPEMIKAQENVQELDDFHDGWIRKAGSVCITGSSHYAGQFDDHGVVRMVPPTRAACRRLRSRCLVLADGRVTICDQDFRGRHVVGNLGEQSLAQLWTGAEMRRIRDAHGRGDFAPTPLCSACDEWHRP